MSWQRARGRVLRGICFWFVVDLMTKGGGNQNCRSVLVTHCRTYRGHFMGMSKGEEKRKKKQKKTLTKKKLLKQRE